MLNIDSNYHTHIWLCRHAIGDIDDYVDRAIELGYKEIGISDHVPLIDEIEKKLVTRRMTKEEYRTIYLPSLARAKKKYQGKIVLYSALEAEYFEAMHELYPQMLNEVDYLILGQHYLPLTQGRFFSVYDKMTPARLDVYAQTVTKALNTGWFTILAHPDIYLFNNPDWNAYAIKIAEQIIDACIANDVYLEMNANGIRKRSFLNPEGEIVYRYPRLEFWRLVRSKGAKVIINDDCHLVEHLHDQATLTAYQMAEAIGIKYSTRITLPTANEKENNV
ncbi:MAG: histidinol-phosphatase [Bacilli bacterium]|jgi:histidinol-phosphatase (PHP family)|nr:histidinol-phosphatase [Bacilli bacterium]HHU24594.1 histidinol-phosphatase [Acholeplasmataceae bacterium]